MLGAGGASLPTALGMVRQRWASAHSSFARPAPRRISRISRSCGLLDHSFCQWATGKAVTARMSGAASASNSANPTATAAAIDRVVHHSVILEFDVPSYRTIAAQRRGQAEEVNRRN